MAESPALQVYHANPEPEVEGDFAESPLHAIKNTLVRLLDIDRLTFTPEELAERNVDVETLARIVARLAD